MGNFSRRFHAGIGSSLALVGVIVWSAQAAAQEKTGSVVGQLKSQKDTPDGKNTFIEVLAPGEEKARRYHVLYDQKAKGPIPSVLAAVRAAKVGDRVELDWVQTGHGSAIKGFQVLRKGADALKSEPEDKAHRDDKLRELLKERLATAQALHGLAVKAYMRGDPRTTVIQVREAKITLLEAHLGMADTKAQRLKVLEDMAADAAEWEQAVGKHVQAGVASQIDQLRATLYRLERRIALERARME